MRIVQADEIEYLSKQGLIIRDQFRSGNCEGIGYGLTLGPRVQSISRTEEAYRRIEGVLVLAPSEAVNVEVNEKFNLVDRDGVPRYFGLVVSGARLLAGGVAHPATYIDAGFRRTASLTLINLRNFPSRAFRPGSDIIAKLIVIELSQDEIPPDWEETPAYRQSGPDDLPVLWPDFHLMPGRPVSQNMDTSVLQEIAEYSGYPFDVLAMNVLTHQRLLHRRDGEEINLEDSFSLLRGAESSINRTVEFLMRRVDAVEREYAKVEGKAVSALSIVEDLKEARFADRDRRTRDKMEGRRFWVTTIVAVLSAVIGAILTIILSHFWLH